MKAGINLAVGFLGCMAQLGGMGGAIYILFDWNTVEPWTWIFQSFYLMVGSMYYMMFRSDWCYTTTYDFFYKRNLNKIAKQQNFNLTKNDYLKEFIEFT